VLITIFANISFANKEEVKKEISEFLMIMENQDIDKILDYMYPRFFELTPREDMIQRFNKALKDQDHSLYDSKIVKIGDIKNSGDTSYCFIDYTYTMSFNYDIDNPETKEIIKTTEPFMKATFGADNVTADYENSKLIINNNKTMIAISQPDYDGWKFIDKEPQLKEILKSILPVAILKEL
jgi:hypothetical protein